MIGAQVNAPTLAIQVRPEVPAHIKGYNANLRRQANRRYFVIEVATGEVVVDCTPLAHGYAEYVRKTLDFFSTGTHVLREVHVNPAQLLQEALNRRF
jgi:hypothetical protein